MFWKFILIIFVITNGLLITNAQNTACNFDTTLCYINKKFDSDFNIQMEKKWEFDTDIVHRQSSIILDLDYDCTPEIIGAGFQNYNINLAASNQIIVLDSKKKSVKQIIPTFYFRANPANFTFLLINNSFELIVAVADIDINPMSVRGRLVCYNADQSIKWISDQKYVMDGVQSGNLSLADFNKDGITEVYIHNNIFNSVNGVLLVSGKRNGIGGTGFSTISIAANLDNDANDLELAAGYTVYKVKITNLSSTTGNTMIANNIIINNLYPNGQDGITAIADINNDQKLDIVVLHDLFQKSGIYIYTFQNNSYQVFTQVEFKTTEPIGILTLGEVTQKGKIDILVSSVNKIRKFSFNNSVQLQEDWNFEITERSGAMGISLFDFDNDGIHEIVYRDEKELAIISAKNNIINLKTKEPCISITGIEYPVIADIDGSGETKICIPCATQFNDQNGKLTIFGPSPGQRWAPARKIWHQYVYNPLFINDDSTVPQDMQNPAVYKNGKYNNFMVQESLLDEDGNYNVPAASLTGTISCIAYDVAEQQYTVNFNVNNRADASASAVIGVPVAFYNGNPESGGSLIGVYRTSADIKAGNTLNSLTYSFAATDLSSIYMVINTDKFPIFLSDTSYYYIEECDYTDNILIAPAPKIMGISQEICQGDSYTFYGTALTASGTYYQEIPNVSGCDSVIYRLDLKVSNVKTKSINTSACDTYEWNGKTYTTDGAYTYQTLSVYGCDSITTLNLRINPSKQVTINQQGCGAYIWNGKSYTQSGIYSYRAQNIHGCDSTYILNLIIHPEYEVRTAAEACAQYVWPVTQQRYTQSGTYNLPLKSAQGCDSTVTLDLMIYPEFEFRDTVVSAEPYLWPINNETYENSGVYTQTFSTDVSCDSVHYLYLTIKNSTEIFFPNIISTDGANGFFTGYSGDASVMISSLAVYDRWGNLIFSKENFPVNDPQQGWDGKISGREVVPGAYIWLAVVQLKDGSLETYSGDVTVVR